MAYARQMTALVHLCAINGGGNTYLLSTELTKKLQNSVKFGSSAVLSPIAERSI